MGKVFSNLLGVVGLGGAAKAPQAAAPAAIAPKLEDEVKGEQATAKKARASLYGTAGGVVGEELDPSQVKKRQTLLGN